MTWRRMESVRYGGRIGYRPELVEREIAVSGDDLHARRRFVFPARTATLKRRRHGPGSYSVVGHAFHSSGPQRTQQLNSRILDGWLLFLDSLLTQQGAPWDPSTGEADTEVLSQDYC
jgi:hypothetical protein